MTAEISSIRQEVKLCTTTTASLEKNITTSTSSQIIMGAGEKTTYNLSYFDIRGRAEPIRMLFALAGVKYTDTRISQGEWPALKQKAPFGQLPVLEISGAGMKAPITINQTHTILRHLAREFGLDGRNMQDKLKVDIITETMRDCIEPIADIFNEVNDNKKSEVLSKYCDELLPKFLDYLTDNLNEEWFLDQVSLADILIYVAFDNVSMFIPDFLDNKSYWKLREWRSRFESHPKIHDWLTTRPDTPY